MPRTFDYIILDVFAEQPLACDPLDTRSFSLRSFALGYILISGRTIPVAAGRLFLP